jgi:hypothetical protein
MQSDLDYCAKRRRDGGGRTGVAQRCASNADPVVGLTRVGRASARVTGGPLPPAHAPGATVRPAIWPTPILNEEDSLAFDIPAVASPTPGSALTVVIQT